MTSVAVEPARRMRLSVRPLPRAVRLGLVAVVTLIVAYGAISLRVAEGVTHVSRAFVEGSGPAIAGRVGENVSFLASGGLTLRGWFYRNAGDRAVIFVHGKDSNRTLGTYFERVGDVLFANGYSLLTFDARGHGVSDGERFSLGQHERHDIAAAIAFLERRGFTAPRIALLGTSMGAAQVLQAVEVRPDVGPVIADSGFADGRVAIEEVGPRYTGLPTWFNPGIILAARVFDIDVDQIRPAAIVRANPARAYYFIHCDMDTTVLPHHSPDLATASANAGTRLWIAAGCRHVEAFETRPAEYASRLLAFLAANTR